MRLEESFDDFLRNTVSLDDTRRSRAQRAHNTVRRKLKAIDEVRACMIGNGSFLQGSYALHTATRPCHEDMEYDVDVVLTLDLADENGNLPGGYEVLSWLQSHLESINLYEGKTEMLDHCVRIQYESDDQRFHLDVVPAHCPDTEHDPILIPSRWLVLSGDWKASHPKGFVAWLTERKNEQCDAVRGVTRLLKYWRNLHNDDGAGPNSMLLTTLIGLHAPADYRSLDDALVKAMRSICDWMSEQDWLDDLVVDNPSLPGENLARSWDMASFSTFQSCLSAATEKAEEARASKDEEETIALWNSSELFDDCFPKTTRGLGEEALRFAATMSSGGASVGATGRISLNPSRGGARVRDNRGFFGKETG